MDIADLQSRIVAGAAAGNMTVTGIQLGDVLWEVLDLNGPGANLVAEFKVTADNTINNTGGTSTAGHNVMVRWLKHYKIDRHKFEGTQRSDSRTRW